MKWAWFIGMAVVGLLSFGAEAQSLQFAPPLNERFLYQYNIAGEAGGFIWMERTNFKRGFRRSNDPWGPDKQQLYEIYNSRLQPERTVVPPDLPEQIVKVFSIAGPEYFDQLLLSGSGGHTRLSVRRYRPDGSQEPAILELEALPFRADADSYLLLRSANKQRILLLGFESVPDSAPRLHAYLFNASWQRLFRNTYRESYISQPWIQYDFEEKPLEAFSNSPLKLCDNGDWLMASPSRKNRNYQLLHFAVADSSCAITEIPVPAAATMEDLSLYLEEDEQLARLGLLCRFRYQPVKHVSINTYSLKSARIIFDTAYDFNTLAGVKVRNERLVQEYLIPVPGRGFLLLKEYGRDYRRENEEATYQIPAADTSDPLMNSIIGNTLIPVQFNPNDYTRVNRLGAIRPAHNRGDLSMFYLPASAQDSCWSGIINQEQRTELNQADLSYLVLPVSGRLYILYNSIYRRDYPLASSTVLDPSGRALPGQGVVFWRMNDSFNFQHARQINGRKVAIPYERNGRMGFAVMNL